MCADCQRHEELGCERSLSDPDSGPLASLGWTRDYCDSSWDRCPGWYARRAPIGLRRLVSRAERLAALAEIGCPPHDLTEAGEQLVVLARRYRDRVSAEERARVAREEERRRKGAR